MLFVIAFNNVYFPTFGSPTIPAFKLIINPHKTLFDYKQNTVNKFYSNEKEFYDYLHDHYDFKHNQNHLMIESNQKEAYLQYLHAFL